MLPGGPEEAKRDIPPGVRRAVRQRCGFGCVICGLPLYEYEHMAGWANVHRHEAAEITLLCDRHHREKTGGLLPIAAVRAADADPFNRRMGVSAPYALHYAGDECGVVIGSNSFSASTQSDLAAVMVDGIPLVGFRFEDGHYLLNVLLFNEANELVLQVADNELVYSSQPWDIELVGTRLILRAGAGSIFIDINFRPPNGLAIERGRLLCNGAELFVRPEFALLVNNASLIVRNSSQGGVVGLNIGADPRGLPSAFRFDRIPRYGYDRAGAIRWARKRMGAAAEGLPDAQPGTAAEPPS
jgi:hypothetical protein